MTITMMMTMTMTMTMMVMIAMATSLRLLLLLLLIIGNGPAMRRDPRIARQEQSADSSLLQPRSGVRLFLSASARAECACAHASTRPRLLPLLGGPARILAGKERGQTGQTFFPYRPRTSTLLHTSLPPRTKPQLHATFRAL
jgi:hypothetical protein